MSRVKDDFESSVANRFKTTDFRKDYNAEIHAVLGVVGEAGELADAFKKCWVYGKPIDWENVIEEMGDIEFYLEALRQLTGVTRKECLEANNKKLAKRYPDGYTDKAAIVRADKLPFDTVPCSGGGGGC